MSPMPFDVRSETLDDEVRAVSVRGELDMNTAPDLERVLEKVLDAREGSVLIDLADCEFIDSTGIALIVRYWQRLHGNGSGRLAICCVNDQVLRLLEITGVESSISMYRDRDEALAELRG